MHDRITLYCQNLIQKFDKIPSERKELLQKISTYIQAKIDKKEEVQLMYVCTHNSRRSHFGQIWAAVAASFYGIEKVQTFSGGTEETALHPNAIAALSRVGFEIQKETESTNPRYMVSYGVESSLTCFSKVYDDKSNPSANFAAIMTCADAEDNCPFIPGVELRIATSYEDPKAFDGTDLEQMMYDKRCTQIALETLFVFSLIKNVKN